jgi:hypothetical protein
MGFNPAKEKKSIHLGFKEDKENITTEVDYTKTREKDVIITKVDYTKTREKDVIITEVDYNKTREKGIITAEVDYTKKREKDVITAEVDFTKIREKFIPKRTPENNNPEENPLENVYKSERIIEYDIKQKQNNQIQPKENVNEISKSKEIKNEEIEKIKMKKGYEIQSAIDHIDINKSNKENIQIKEFDIDHIKKQDLIDLIDSLSKNKKITLNMFRNIASDESMTELELVQFKTTAIVLKNLIQETDLPRYIKSTKMLQMMIDGKYYISKGEKNFERLLENDSERFGGIIYDIKCKDLKSVFSNLSERHYIGRTWMSDFDRFIGHIKDSLDPENKHTRFIEKAIRLALKDAKKNPDELWDETKDFNDVQQQAKLEEIANLLIKEYFEVNTIELHRNYETTRGREAGYIKNFKHHVEGRLIIGTKNPKGLNMYETGAGADDFKSLPLYDIAFMLALGQNVKNITEQLNSKVHNNISVNRDTVNLRINKAWKSLENAQELFFKPVLQKIITHKNNFDIKDIAKLMNRSKEFGYGYKFRNFFDGLSYQELKPLVRADDFKWENLKKLAKGVKDGKKIRGYSLNQWEEWFIRDIGLKKIAESTKYKKKVVNIKNQHCINMINN